MQLVILASGKGSRLGYLTKSKPKCFVKINNQSLIYYLKKNFFKFENVFIIAGYKYQSFKNLDLGDNVKIINNKKYKDSNMVYSLFCAKKFVTKDIIVSYSDILFDPSIIDQMIKYNFSHIPLNKSWLKFWSQRMKKNLIKNDAEDVVTKNKQIIKIGSRIGSRFPKYQFMGLLKLKLDDFNSLYKIFKILNNNNIDMTKFINYSIKEHNFKLRYFISNKYWYEVDSISDYNLVNNIAKI